MWIYRVQAESLHLLINSTNGEEEISTDPKPTQSKSTGRACNERPRDYRFESCLQKSKVELVLEFTKSEVRYKFYSLSAGS